MSDIRITIDRSEVSDWLETLIDGMDEQAGYMVEGVLNVYELVSRYSSPVKTGDLMNSIISEVDGLSGDVIPTIFYAQWVILGRGEVVPVNAKALWWPGLDHPVMRSGPSRPNDFMQTGFDAANSGGEIDNLCDQFLDWCIA
jgi:hypothetical protein